jgi:hypothetical protein
MGSDGFCQTVGFAFDFKYLDGFVRGAGGKAATVVIKDRVVLEFGQ